MKPREQSFYNTYSGSAGGLRYETKRGVERNDHRIQGFIVFRTREDIVVQAFIISGEKINEEKTLKLYACLIIWGKKQDGDCCRSCKEFT